jgi:two-component system response regulator QseB
MSLPTVYLFGVDDLHRIVDFLSLGAIVVVAPDRPSLRRWEEDVMDGDPLAVPETPSVGLMVDLDGRRVRWNGLDLRLTPLEFRVLSVMLASPGRAFSFHELRTSGWGQDREQGIDVFAVRSVVQRLRAKLRKASVPQQIESVRGFGFRMDRAPDAPSSGLTMVR